MGTIEIHFGDFVGKYGTILYLVCRDRSTVARRRACLVFSLFCPLNCDCNYYTSVLECKFDGAKCLTGVEPLKIEQHADF